MKPKVRKAVFPAAGFGTRFLPATKAIPKEMLAVVDKPIIQYGVEEAIAAGCEQIIIITARGKSAIEDHFDISYELESSLEKRGKKELLEVSRRVSNMADLSYVRQKEAKGLGHAVLMAKELVGDEPFAVILPDDVIDAPVPCLKQMIDVFEQVQGSVAGNDDRRRTCDLCLRRARRLPSAGQASHHRGPRHGGKTETSRCTVKERDYRPLYPHAGNLRVDREADSYEAGGELQLTDGIKGLLKTEKVYGYTFDGIRHDAGDKLGMLKATVDFALKREDLGPPFREFLKSLSL